ncbi:MAG: acyltransferase family protein [Acidimicrobiales bacterium]
MLAAPPEAGHLGRSTRLTYRPALDGLRALAVIAVFAYHAGLPWARAGFLGVDVFFVLSGFLITALLLVERHRTGGVDLLNFWRRRARRLLPALIVLLAAVAVAVPLLAPEQAYRLRGDLLAALGYVSNWRLIFEDQSYFQAAGRPPVLQHLWSLAVEEQFYLLWPVVLVWALRGNREFRPQRLVRPLLLVSAASAVLMALLFHPYEDPSRVYYGTDTRLAALLLGAALACGTARWQQTDRLSRGARLGLETAGLFSLVGLAWAVSGVNEFEPRLYRGGFLAFAALAAAVVAAAARPGPRGPVTALLGIRPMVWLGRRSYAIYLWFWPVLMLTRPDRDVPVRGTANLALRISITLALAAASYRFVERPARAGAIGRLWSDLLGRVQPKESSPRPSAIWAFGITVAFVCVGIGVMTSHRSPEPLDLNVQAAADIAAQPSSTTSVPPSTSTVVSSTTVVVNTTTAAVATTSPPVAAVQVELPVVRARVTAIGDSVLLGAKPLLEGQVEGIVVDAAVGRQYAEILSVARSYRERGLLGDVVVLQTGNNGPISGEQFDQLLEVFTGVGKVLVVNVKVDRPWQDHNNEIMASGVRRWPNATLVDWHAAASADAGAFYSDGLHLTAGGMRLFTGLVLAAI